MKNYYTILLSHGLFAQEALGSVEMIMGEIEDISTIGLFPGMGIEDLRLAVLAVMDSEAAKSKDLVLLLTDIPYGTPTNVALLLEAKNPKIVVITGFNLPLLINVLENDQMDKQQILELLEESKELMKTLSVEAAKNNENVADTSDEEEL